jgi:Lrp/AsnC family transcriptional regulator, leucine-responsive regulatory protein
MVELDAIDLQILDLLQHDGRMSNSDLAQRVGLTAPTVLRRVKLLEERGVIKGYSAQIDPLVLGLNVTAFVLLETNVGCDLDNVSRYLMELPGVLEVHRLIGEWCFLLKVRTQSPQTLEDLIYRVLRHHPGVRRTHSTLATSAAFETTALPIPVGSRKSTHEVTYGTDE